MKTLEIKVEYIAISDLEEMLKRLIKEVKATEKEEINQCYIDVNSNIGGNLTSKYTSTSLEDKRKII